MLDDQQELGPRTAEEWLALKRADEPPRDIEKDAEQGRAWLQRQGEPLRYIRRELETGARLGSAKRRGIQRVRWSRHLRRGTRPLVRSRERRARPTSRRVTRTAAASRGDPHPEPVAVPEPA
jgi:hypothetical protein